MIIRDGLETLTPKTRRDQYISPRDRDICFDGQDKTLVRPRRDRDETLHNSRPLRGVIKVISCSRQGWSTMAKDLHFQHDFYKHHSASEQFKFASLFKRRNQNRLNSVSSNGLETWKVKIETETSGLEIETRPRHLDVAPRRDHG